MLLLPQKPVLGLLLGLVAALALAAHIAIAQSTFPQAAREFYLRSEAGTHYIWKRRADLPEKRSDMALARNLAKGVVYLVGGCAEDSNPECPRASDGIWQYNPERDEYTNLPALKYRRYRHGAAVLGDRLFVFGGIMEGGATADFTEVMDLATGACKSQIYCLWEHSHSN